LGSTISKVDAVEIPSSNPERSRAFYVETLGLRQDERSENEFWIGETCFEIWEPARMGLEFQPQPNGIVLLHVEDVPAARSELEEKGVEFAGDTFDTGVCHMANFADPDGNVLVLHHRYAAYSDGSTP
jgi:catechol 2,3-dioxygenase-like lactoylglutathione lyase family enzyme